LHEVGPVLLGGRIAHPLSAAREALRFYRDFCAEAPDSVIVYAGLATGPDGQLRLGWRAVVNGPAEDGEPLIAPVRGYGTPLLDDIRPQPYIDIQRIIEPLFLPGRLNYWKANFVDELSDELIDVLIDAMTRVPSPYTLIAIEPMGGAIARVPESATAFQHRSASFSLLILSSWEDPADTDVSVTWTRELFARTEPLCSAGVYVNYLGLEGDQRVRDAFGMNYDRLVQVKQRYDPGNFFRLNQNIAAA
jgi:hypothetical protein